MITGLVKVKFPGGREITVNPKMILGCSLKEDIEIDEMLNIEQETFLNIVMGLEARVPDTDLMDYFVFFGILEMIEHQYLVVKDVEKLNNISTLLTLWKKTSERYEKEKKAELQSVFSVGVMNSLWDKEDNVKKEEGVDKELLKRLESYQIKNIKEHDAFKGKIDDFPKTYQEIVKKCLTKMYENRDEDFNVTLKTEDGGAFKVHREIIIWKSNFFHRMIKFGGAEAEEMKNSGVITLSTLDKDELGAFIQFMYKSTVDTESFATIFKLLCLTEEYREIPLKNFLLEHIRKISKKLRDLNTLEEEFLQHGKFLENEQIINEVADWLFTIIEREKLLKLVEKSKE